MSASYGSGSVASESDVSVRRNCTCSIVLKVYLQWGGEDVSDSGIVLSLSVDEMIMMSLSVSLVSLLSVEGHLGEKESVLVASWSVGSLVASLSVEGALGGEESVQVASWSVGSLVASLSVEGAL